MASSAIDKYLANYAEPELALLAELPKHYRFKHVLVIPAYKENADFIQRFYSSSLADENVLIIVVINQPDNDVNTIRQQKLHDDICLLGDVKSLNAQLTLVECLPHNSVCLLVNRFDFKIPHKQGVGLARKIGCDLALALIHQGIVSSTFIASTDADASLPADYFTKQNTLDVNVSAAIYNFDHYSENIATHQANQLYQSALKYFYSGLKYANSPYAFFTIGSVLVLNSEKYAQARGFPKRSAGEDFYLLNKLAKVGAITYFEDSQITLTARISDRVPFGTGPAVAKIIALQQQRQEYTYYSPQVFEELKRLNDVLPHLYCCRDNLDDWLENLSLATCYALHDIGFNCFIEKQKNAKEQQFNKQWIVWFDGFKTLKFIHALREHSLNDIPLTAALASAAFPICR